MIKEKRLEKMEYLREVLNNRNTKKIADAVGLSPVAVNMFKSGKTVNLTIINYRSIVDEVKSEARKILSDL